ncbi:hypothetical protein SLI_6246 [Streptomyces lividans 1326]|uniref:Uncharacterized protein n=1 Tax=Streptomyces lividans 1326 TaxID=1200984 RepID=A0A7U9HDM9_STRLI|nr:hypothetical protein SLI_6246 [Streptomyces lividans 1326]
MGRPAGRGFGVLAHERSPFCVPRTGQLPAGARRPRQVIQSLRVAALPGQAGPPDG